MFDLQTIKFLNQSKQIKKAQKLARALNFPKGHPKDTEKGRKKKVVWTRADRWESWDA